MPPRRPAPADALVHALTYTRVSGAEQAREGISLDAQLAECRRYAAARGWLLGTEYTDILSGTKDQRPQYQALLQACRDRRAQGQAVAVVILRLDRLGRRLIERVRARDELKALGIPVHSVREGGEVSDLVSNILASVAQEEVRLLGERVSDARQHLARQGWWSGGRPPWGYRLRPATTAERQQGAPQNVLEVDPTTAPFAVEAVERFIGGASVHAVARWLATLPPAARSGRQLGYKRVRLWLAAEAPRGLVAGQPGRWLPLIDAGQAAAIDARIAGWATGRRQPSGRYLLAGLLTCGECGARMVGHAMRGRAARYQCVRWSSALSPLGACTFGVVAGTADARVLEAVSARLAPFARHDRAFQRELTRAWQAQQRPPMPGPSQQQTLERARAQAQRRLRDAATLFVDGELDRAGYEAVRLEEEAALAAATAALAALPSTAPVAIPDLVAVRALAQDWPTLCAQAEPMALRAVLLELLEGVTVQRQGVRQWTVTLRWSALGESLEGWQRDQGLHLGPGPEGSALS